MANYQLSLTGEEINERLEAIGTKDDAAAADGSLFARTTELQVTSTQYSGRIQTNEEAIEKNGDRITAAEKSISVNATNISTNKETITAIGEQVTKNVNNIADHETRLTAAEGKLTTHTNNIKDISIEVDDHHTALNKHTEQIATNEAATATNAADIARINDTMGPYTDRPSVALTASETGKVIDATGTKVSKSGWAIAEFTAEKGNVYLFKPGATDSNVCVFAEKITSIETRTIDYSYTYNSDGTIATAVATYLGTTHTYTYTYNSDGTCTIKEGSTVVDSLPLLYKTTVGSYSPLVRLNADAELPKDGYCRYMSHFKGDKSITIAVSYKVGSADLTMRVTRDGVLASISTQLGNLSQREDETRTQLVEKVPTMWVNILATKDTAVMADGVRVEIPAYTNTVIKDFKTVSVETTNVPDPECFTRFDIHYNGIAKLKQFQLGKDWWKIDGTSAIRGMSNVETLDVSGIDTSEMTTLFSMFCNMQKVKTLDVSGFDTSNVDGLYNFLAIFLNCYSLESVDVSNWDTSKATTLQYLFCDCRALQSIDVSNWVTNNVTSMQKAFNNCQSLTSLDLHNWDTSSATDVYAMFSGCTSLTDITFGEGFGKAKASGLTLDLSTCGSSKSYVLTDNTYNSMLTMYDRATNGLPTMTIKFNAKHNLPDGFVAAMTARGYTITQ